jgi:Spy/CpxP family protein refolding chaperone
MKRLFPVRFLASLFALAAFALVAAAQEPPASFPPADAKPAEVRANALRQLGLTRDQLMEIRKINQARKPQMEQAQARLRIANTSLEEAIYSDKIDEQVFQARLREFQAAQTEVSRIRFVNELAVRRVLSADQVGRFRQIRERFDRARQVRDTNMPAAKKLIFPKLKRGTPPNR